MTKYCKDCLKVWSGKKWPRKSGKNKGGWDYECHCGSKKKPVKEEDLPIVKDCKKREEEQKARVVNVKENHKKSLKGRRILFIADSHLPYEHEDYLGFVCSIRDKYDCTEFYHVGDLIDNHAISMHEHDPNLSSPEDEYQETKRHLEDWYKEFPVLSIAFGNHDNLNKRQAKKAGIPSRYIKSLLDAYEAPEGWTMAHEFWLDDYTKVIHGTGYNGKYPHANASQAMMCNVIMGHTHSVAGVHYTASERALIWGMAVGCGIDREKRAFDYAKTFPRKPILSCGVLVDGVPTVEFMEL